MVVDGASDERGEAMRKGGESGRRGRIYIGKGTLSQADQADAGKI